MGNTKKTFGFDTVNLVVGTLDHEQLDRWLMPLTLSQRIEMVIAKDSKIVDQLVAKWHGHNEAVNEFDFDDVTAVEVDEKILAAVRS